MGLPGSSHRRANSFVALILCSSHLCGTNKGEWRQIAVTEAAAAALPPRCKVGLSAPAPQPSSFPVLIVGGVPVGGVPALQVHSPLSTGHSEVLAWHPRMLNPHFGDLLIVTESHSWWLLGWVLRHGKAGVWPPPPHNGSRSCWRELELLSLGVLCRVCEGGRHLEPFPGTPSRCGHKSHLVCVCNFQLCLEGLQRRMRGWHHLWRTWHGL